MAIWHARSLRTREAQRRYSCSGTRGTSRWNRARAARSSG